MGAGSRTVLRGAGLSIVVMATVGSVGGCGGAKALTVLAAEEGDDVGRLVRSSRWVPRQVPPAELARVSATEVRSSAGGFAARVQDLDRADAIDVVTSACEMADLADATKSNTAFATYLRDKGKASWVYRQRAADLGESFVKATATRDKVALLGRAAVCEAASHAG